MTDLPIGGRLPLDRYRQMMDDSPIVTVDVMILSPDCTKLLLGKRSNEPYKDVYFSFGSRLYKNEKFVDAARRIAKEELGLDVPLSKLVFAGVTADFGDTSIFEGITYHSVDIYFAHRMQAGQVMLDNQHSDMKWFSLDDQTLHPYVLNRIEGVRKVLDQI